MPLVTSDLLIGSYPSLPAQTVTVTTAGPVTTPHDIATGNYHLYDDGSAFDLMFALATAINGHAAISDCVVEFLRNRRIRITASVAFALTWPADSLLRNLLGFTGNLVSATSHTATNISTLLWSPGKVARYAARLGTDGIPIEDVAWGQSGPGTVYATSNNLYRRNELSWRYLLNDRVWSTSEANGEFIAFYRNVLIKARRFKVWRGVPDDSASSVVLDPAGDGSGVLPSSGAYVYQPAGKLAEMPWAREFGFKEAVHPITIPCSTTVEYT